MFQASNNVKTFLNSALDPAVLVELYPADSAPPFNPANAYQRFSSVGGVNFLGLEYKRLIKNLGKISKPSGKERASTSITFDNLNNWVTEFFESLKTLGEDDDFEGLILVIRLISQSLSNSIDDSLILFAGKSETIDEGNLEQISLRAYQPWGNPKIKIPRRKFSPEDEEGRLRTDPLFEGFVVLPQYGVTTYTRRTKGFLGLFKKTKRVNLQWSSFSDIDADKDLPVAFGRVQMQGVNLSYADFGTNLKASTAFCEGLIDSYVKIYADDIRWSKVTHVERYGHVGGTNGQTPIAGYPGNATYSNTAWVASEWTGTSIDSVDPAPGIIAILLGLVVKIPNSSGLWNVAEWSDNMTALAYYLLTNPHYENLATGWLNASAFTKAFRYNDEFLFDRAFSDLIFIPNGSLTENLENANFLRSTGSVSINYFLNQLKLIENKEAFATQAEYQNYNPALVPPDDPIEIPPTGGTTEINLSVFLRKRYTTNVLAYEKQELIDFVYDVGLRNSRMFLFQNLKGEIEARHWKPADFALMTSNSTSGATTLVLDDVSAFIASARGHLLIAPHTTVSEIKNIQSVNYTLSQNSTTVTASANVTVTGFSGCNGTTTPATATLEVTTVDDTDITLDGVSISVVVGTADTIQTIAGFLYASINAHPRLRRRFTAVWNDDRVTITARFGQVVLASPCEFAHIGNLADPDTAPTVAGASGGDLATGVYQVCYAFETANGRTLPSPRTAVTVTANQKLQITGITPPAGSQVVWYISPGADSLKLRKFKTGNASFEVLRADLPLLSDELTNDENKSGTEILRVEKVFSDRASDRSNIAGSNVLRSSYRWKLGKKNDQTNQVEIAFRDATQDFRLTTLRIKDKAHIRRVGKVNNLEINGQSIDSFHQAYRIASAELNLRRNADFFYNFASDKGACLLEPGDVVAITDSGSGVLNFPVFIKDIDYDLKQNNVVNPSFVVQKYATSLFDDSVVEREIPVVRGTEVDYSDLLENLANEGKKQAEVIVLSGDGAGFQSFTPSQTGVYSIAVFVEARPFADGKDSEVATKVMQGSTDLITLTNGYLTEVATLAYTHFLPALGSANLTADTTYKIDVSAADNIDIIGKWRAFIQYEGV